MKKNLFTIFLLSIFVLSSNAQAAQLNKRIDKINRQIIESNPSIPLTSDQRVKIYYLLLQLRKKVRELKEEHGNSEEFLALRKEENKKVHKIISNEILTKEQRIALRTTRKKYKNKNKKE